MGLMRLLILLSVAIVFPLRLFAQEIQLFAPAGDGMVLQARTPNTIRGIAPKNGNVVAELAGQTVEALADADGRFSLTFAPSAASMSPHTLSVRCGEAHVVLQDVVFGEVWLCSGQSNMEWTLEAVQAASAEIKDSRLPMLRAFTVERSPLDEPVEQAKGRWTKGDQAEVAKVSAVAWFLGKRLHADLKVPIGLIVSAFGGTPAEAWTSAAALSAHPELQGLLTRSEKAPQSRASRLFNGMIAPLRHVSLSGVTWYQGESNVPRAWQYRTLLAAMIADWRSHFGRPDLPFLIVQIAPFPYAPPRSGRADAAELRDAQLHVHRSLPNTGLVVTTDLGNISDIHPKEKQPIGERLARWALRMAYGRTCGVSGPLYKSARFEGRRAILSFDHAYNLHTTNGQPLSHFEIAGEDQKFVPAIAILDGYEIICQADEVKKAVAVRFAWSDTANPNLINEDRLPAAPFRTDDWPLLTRDAR